MSKLGKFVVALALCLTMSLALFTTSFAQSAHPSNTAHTAVTTTAQVAHSARWGGWGWGWGGGGWGWSSGWGWGGGWGGGCCSCWCGCGW
jgi:hypothetical protein